MQINEVIRKYRKENNLTQEEMANRLGVTAPAVNKWESGSSMPDITLLAPIARLLHITLDELLSFKDRLSEVEITNILRDVYAMFNTNPLEEVHARMIEIIREYPNAENLTLSLAEALQGRCLILPPEERAKYNDWIEKCHKDLLSSADASVRIRAAEALYAMYVMSERYDEAEKCLEYLSPDNPTRDRKLATIYYGTERYEEAYKLLEKSMFSDYSAMSSGIRQILMVAVKVGDYKKAQQMAALDSALADLFDMGEYHKNVSNIECAKAMKDAGKTLELMDILLTNTNTLMDYTKSSLYEHMTFNEPSTFLMQTVFNNQLKLYLEDDAYSFVREAPEWEKFKEKWYKA